jgi:hypothetical protein
MPLAAIVLIIASPGLPALAGVYEAGTAGAVRPPVYFPGLRYSDHLPGGSGAVLSVSNPYSIPGLHRLDLDLWRQTGPGRLWCSWADIQHELYDEDRISLGFVAGFPCRLDAGVTGTFNLRGVTGSEREEGISWKGIVSVQWREVAAACCQVLLEDPGRFEDERYMITLSLNFPGNSLIFSRRYYCWGEAESIAGLKIDVTRSLNLLGGYRFACGEISVGLVYRAGGFLFGTAWRGHPVLGSTPEFAAGKVGGK